MAPEYLRIDKLLKERTMITWSDLPYLFVGLYSPRNACRQWLICLFLWAQNPGTLLVERAPENNDDFQAYRQVSAAEFGSYGNGKPAFIIPAQRYVLAGNRFRLESSTLLIKKCNFKDEAEEVPLALLPVIPLSLARDCDYEFLEQRGLTCWELQKPQPVSYSGPIADSGAVFVSNGWQTPYHRHGDVGRLTEKQKDRNFMIDSAVYDTFVVKERRECVTSRKQDEPAEPEFEFDLEPDGTSDPWDIDGCLPYLMPYAVHGFDLHDNVWRKLLVEHISLEPSWFQTPVDGLLMPSGADDLISERLKPFKHSRSISRQAGPRTNCTCLHG
jgi:hypothetical protein